MSTTEVVAIIGAVSTPTIAIAGYVFSRKHARDAQAHDREMAEGQREHERQQQFRERQLLLAADFISAIEQTLLKCNVCWELSRRRLFRSDFAAPLDLLHDSHQLVEKLWPQFTVLSLLLGPRSRAAEAAAEAFRATREAQQATNNYYYAVEDNRTAIELVQARADLSDAEKGGEIEDLPAKFRRQSADELAKEKIQAARRRLSECQEVIHAALRGGDGASGGESRQTPR